MPTLSNTPTSSTAPPASGSQVWNGTSGALIAKARKKPRNSHRCVVGSISSATRASNANVPCPSWRLLITYRPITEASMISPPSRL